MPSGWPFALLGGVSLLARVCASVLAVAVFLCGSVVSSFAVDASPSPAPVTREDLEEIIGDPGETSVVNVSDVVFNGSQSSSTSNLAFDTGSGVNIFSGDLVSIYSRPSLGGSSDGSSALGFLFSSSRTMLNASSMRRSAFVLDGPKVNRTFYNVGRFDGPLNISWRWQFVGAYLWPRTANGPITWDPVRMDGYFPVYPTDDEAAGLDLALIVGYTLDGVSHTLSAPAVLSMTKNSGGMHPGSANSFHFSAENIRLPAGSLVTSLAVDWSSAPERIGLTANWVSEAAPYGYPDEPVVAWDWILDDFESVVTVTPVPLNVYYYLQEILKNMTSGGSGGSAEKFDLVLAKLADIYADTQNLSATVALIPPLLNKIDPMAEDVAAIRAALDTFQKNQSALDSFEVDPETSAAIAENEAVHEVQESFRADEEKLVGDMGSALSRVDFNSYNLDPFDASVRFVGSRANDLFEVLGDFKIVYLLPFVLGLALTIIGGRSRADIGRPGGSSSGGD